MECPLDEVCVSGICLKTRGAPPAAQQRCNVNTDCGPAQECAGGVCQSNSWKCTRNEDCGTNEACLAGSCQQLYASNPPGSGYWCNVDAQCTVYETCQNYHCERCQAGQCLNRGSLAPCWQDSQCLIAEICTQGLCQTKPCQVDNQCGYTEVCDPNAHVCVDCTAGLSLANPNLPLGSSFLSSGSYLGSSLSYGSSSYGYNSASTTTTTGTCTGTGSGYWCYSDSQCPMNEVCDGSNCRSTGPPVPFQCTTDAQCGLNQRCNYGLCVAGASASSRCIYDTDCAYNQICQSGVCVSGGYAAWVPHN